MPPILLANLACALLLTGLIWTVQLVHYPLFGSVGQVGLAAYVRAHGARIGLLVAPLMSLELIAAGWMAIRPPPSVPGWAAWSGLGLVAAIWVVTAAVFVPVHGRLAATPTPADLAMLVSANWLRTGAWTARSALLLWLASDRA